MRGDRQAGKTADTLAAAREARRRGAEVIGVGTQETAAALASYVDMLLTVQAMAPFPAPVTSVIPLQLFAYHVACLHGNDVD